MVHGFTEFWGTFFVVSGLLTLRGEVAAASRRVVSIKMVLSNGNLLSIYCSELQQQQQSVSTELASRRINHDSQTAGLSLVSLSLSLSLLSLSLFPNL